MERREPGRLYLEQLRKKIYISIIGPAGAGKTSVIRRFLWDRFQVWQITHGVESYEYSTTTEQQNSDEKYREATVCGEPCDLYLIDTMGQERYDSFIMRNMLFRKSSAVIIMVSVDDKKWKESVLKWVNKLKEAVFETEAPPIILMGNKADLEESESWFREAEQFINKGTFITFNPKTVSAKTGYKVRETIMGIAELAWMYKQHAECKHGSVIIKLEKREKLVEVQRTSCAC